MASALPIRPLPSNVAARLKSSVAITSLNAVVIELFKNSLDASSEKISLSIEYPRGSCTAEDDGSGILPSEFLEDGGLAKPHHTSKHGNPDLAYGHNGNFIASLADLSLVTITSRHQGHRSCNAITINQSHLISRQVPSRTFMLSSERGTCVTVCNLFGNMPVRVKQRVSGPGRLSANRREWEELRAEITSIILSWPYKVHVTVRNVTTGEKILFRGTTNCRIGTGCRDQINVEHICSTLWQAKMIPTPKKAMWVSVSASTHNLSLKGAISVDLAPTKGVQFISLGIHPLRNPSGNHFLYEEINHLFAESSFGSETLLEANENCYFNKDGRRAQNMSWKSLSGSRKGIDRWPMFFIVIDTANGSQIDTLSDVEDCMRAEGSRFSSIIDLLRATTLQFLRNQMCLSTARQRRREASEPARSIFGGHNISDNLANEQRSRGHGESDVPAQTTCPATVHNNKGEPDLIGIDVQLPSFKHGTSAQSQSPFDGWSRVKSGKRNSTVNTSAKDYGCRFSRASTMPLSQIPTNDDAGSSPTVAKSGKITHIPFEDISPPRRSSSARPAASTIEPFFDSGVAWTNPVTKESSLLNGRTGMVLKTTGSSAMKTGSTIGLMRRDNGSFKNVPCIASHDAVKPKLNNWIRNLVADWENPVFQLPQATIPQAPPAEINRHTQYLLPSFRQNCSQEYIDRSFKNCSTGLLGRVSRKALSEAQIISQVDRKFIVIKMASNTGLDNVAGPRHSGEVLAIIDQHAADERCRIEQLMAELCTKPGDGGVNTVNETIKSGIFTTRLERPLCVKLSGHEWKLLSTQLQHFADWGIIFDPGTVAGVPPVIKHEVRVVSLPPGIIERCKAVPKLLVDLIRLEIWKQIERQGPSANTSTDAEYDGSRESQNGGSDKHTWAKKIIRCPQGILDILNSRSCRSAIMFNDELSFEQCQSLISRLADCAFPFQCAHGRPSMIPLVDMGTVDDEYVARYARHGESFAKAFKKWTRNPSGLATT